MVNEKQLPKLPSGFQIEQIVSVVFPGNATLHNCKISKVAFTRHSEPLYDVDVPFHHDDFDVEPDLNYPPKTGFFRLHSVRQWFISYTQEEWDRMQKDEINIKPERKDPTNYSLV